MAKKRKKTAKNKRNMRHATLTRKKNTIAKFSPSLFPRNLSLSLPHLPKALSFFLWNFALPFVLVYGIFLLHEPLLLRPLNLYDEGVSLMGAKRLLVGHIPYKDFFTIYTPLKFAWLSKVFALYEPNIFVARVFSFSVSLFGFTVLYFFFKRFAHPILAAIATMSVAAFGMLSLTPTVILCLLLWFSVFLSRPASPFLPFIGGALFGILFLLRFDFGGFIGFFALLLIAFFFALRKQWKLFFTAFAKAIFAFLIVTAPVYFWIFHTGAWHDFVEQTILFPLFGDYKQLRHLPYESFQTFWTLLFEHPVSFLNLSQAFAWFFWPIPFAIFVLYWGGKTIWHFFRKTPTALIEQGMLTNALLGVSCIAGLLYASHRSDIGHMTFLNILCSIFLFHLVFLFRQKLWGILFLPFFALALYYPASTMFDMRAHAILAPKAQYSFFPFPFPKSPENDNLQKVLDYFDIVPVREKVFVGVKDTSRVYINNVMLPFLLRQPVATKYHELHTGIVTTKKVQQEIIDELQEVKHVVLWETFYCEKNKSCESTGVHDLDEYIAEHFSLVKKIGKYEIMERK